MMKNGDMPAMPIEINGFGQYAPEVYGGLTKREMFAMHFVSALITNGNTYNGFIDVAILYADALLKELDK